MEDGRATDAVQIVHIFLCSHLVICAQASAQNQNARFDEVGSARSVSGVDIQGNQVSLKARGSKKHPDGHGRQEGRGEAQRPVASS